MILNSIILGKNRGPVLIILHGLFGEAKNWLSIGKELSSQFEVHILDQRNHGHSFHDQDHTYHLMSQDIYSYIQYSHIKSFSLIGHSMGGKVAMQFAYDYGAFLKKLIIVDIAPKKYKDTHSLIFKGLKKVLSFSKDRKEAFNILFDYVEDKIVCDFLLKSLVFNNPKKPAFKFNIDALEKNLCHILGDHNTNSRFMGKVYFFSGSKSDYIKTSDLQQILNRFPNANVIKIEDAGHWVHHENKEKFIQCIHQILC